MVAKGYSQILGVDFNDVFLPIIKHNFIRILLSIFAMYDYKIEQIDVKNVFLLVAWQSLHTANTVI